MAARKQSYTLEDAYVIFNGTIVGGVQTLTVVVEQDNQPKHEAGSKKPREIRPGQMLINGSVGRLHLDSEQITNTVDLAEGNNPYFDIVGKTKSKEPERTIKIIDAMFRGFNLDFSLTDDTMLDQDFDACDIDIS